MSSESFPVPTSPRHAQIDFWTRRCHTCNLAPAEGADYLQEWAWLYAHVSQVHPDDLLDGVDLGPPHLVWWDSATNLGDHQ